MSNHNNNISSFENANKYSNENISISIHNDDNPPNSSSNPFPTPPAEDDDNKLVKNNEKDVEKLAKEGWYIFNNSDVMEKSLECEQWIHQYNQSLALPLDERVALLRQRLGHVGKGVRVKPPFFCYMGSNIHLADGVFMNFNCHLLDGAPIEIGENTMFGPCVKIIAVDHPRDPQLREAEWEWAKPIRIGRNCWIGTGTTILQGVTIGDNCIVGANSVVNKDVPANSTVAGAPARIIVKKEKDGN